MMMEKKEERSQEQKGGCHAEPEKKEENEDLKDKLLNT